MLAVFILSGLFCPNLQPILFLSSAMPLSDWFRWKYSSKKPLVFSVKWYIIRDHSPTPIVAMLLFGMMNVLTLPRYSWQRLTYASALWYLSSLIDSIGIPVSFATCKALSKASFSLLKLVPKPAYIRVFMSIKLNEYTKSFFLWSLSNRAFASFILSLSFWAALA